MKGLIVAVAALLMAPMGMAAAQQAAQPLNAEAAKSLADFLNFGPHRAFVIGADGRASWYVGVGGADPGTAVSSALKRCEERGKPPCTLHVVNNYTVTGADWRAEVPARSADAPDIGRLRPEPYWSMRGPKLAAGLIVWSHGYMAGKNATSSAPQPWIGRFTRMGYDLYRFDREWIVDWAGDATALADAVRKAREMGYRRVVLAGQSAGAWVSLAALARGAPVDGVVSIAAAHHGEVNKMRDTTRARTAGRTGEFCRRCLRRRRPHGRRASRLRQERPGCRRHRQPRGLQGPRRGRRPRLRPQVRWLHRDLRRQGHQTAALLDLLSGADLSALRRDYGMYEPPLTCST